MAVIREDEKGLYALVGGYIVRPAFIQQQQTKLIIRRKQHE